MVHDWFSVTRIIGLASYAASLLACGLRGWRCRTRGGAGSLFVALAGVQLALLLDMVFEWRWKLHAWGMRTAMAYGVYDSRRLPQLLALAALAAGMVFCCVLIMTRLHHNRGAAFALVGTLLSLGLWWVEVVSYHPIDMVLYRMIGKAMLVGFIWIGFALVTCLGVWIDSWSFPAG